MLIDGEREARTIDEAFDYVIVGSGAAGATAARTLVDTGARVAVLEEGPAVSTADFGDKLFPGLRRMFRGMGASVARGRAFIPIIQGSCLGGSTVVNSAIVWRIPDDVYAPWREDYGLGDAIPLAALHKNWDVIEEELSVAPTPPGVWGGINRLMDEAKERLRVGAIPTRRNVRDCHGSARCLTGCPFGAKQSMLVSYLPYAERKGAALFAAAKAERIVMEGDRAAAVTGALRTGRRFTLRARKGVLIGASAIQTPGLLARSGVRSSHLGEHFQGHPGCAMLGVFDQPIQPWFGATQGYEADEHRIDERYKIETIALPPEMLFARTPGIGAAWVRDLARSGHMAVWAVQMRAYAQGSVRERFFGTDVQFDLEPRDMDNLRKGLRFTGELFFAAGAREILPGIHGLPARLTSPDQLKLIEEGPDDPSAYSFILSHLFGTARMSVRPQDGVVGTDFAVHGTKNLYVIDSSVFPTNLGVNPQHPIMGVAMLAAQRISERN